MSAEGTSRRYATLDEALDAFRMPAANRAFIAEYLRLVDPIGYYGRSGYIKVIRRDGGPAIQIHAGHATGFQSEAELRLTVGDEAPVWESDRGSGLWGVTHPVSQRLRESAPARATGTDRGGAAGATTASRPARPASAVEPAREICMDCFEEKSFSGQCSCS